MTPTDERLELGIFLPIANNGWLLSRNAPQYMPSFELNRRITDIAERSGLDFVLSMVKYRGYDGDTDFWNHALESITLMTGLAASTERINLYASVAVLTYNPAMVARMIATANEVAGGRFGLNIVSGWNKGEYEPMGLWPGADYYGRRYDYASEFVEVLRMLWRDGRGSYHGKFFDLSDCLCQPKPDNEIPLICAGQSDRGLQFTARYGDYAFTLGDLDDLSGFAAKLDAYTRGLERSVGLCAVYGIIADETTEAAKQRARHLMSGFDHAGFESMARSNDTGIKDVQGSTGIDAGLSFVPDIDAIDPEAELAGYVNGAVFVGPYLVGSYAQVAAYLDAAKERAGVRGVMLVFPDFIEDQIGFVERVVPLMRSRAGAALSAPAPAGVPSPA